MADILSRRALPAGRLAALGARREFHHGLQTLVAAARASRLAARGAKVLMLCYNVLLAEHIARTARGFSVCTFHSFCRHVCAKANIPFAVPESDEGKRRWVRPESCGNCQGGVTSRLNG
jgi:hypothetical protein